jgi:hypothetical protein
MYCFLWATDAHQPRGMCGKRHGFQSCSGNAVCSSLGRFRWFSKMDLSSLATREKGTVYQSVRAETPNRFANSSTSDLTSAGSASTPRFRFVVESIRLNVRSGNLEYISEGQYRKNTNAESCQRAAASEPLLNLLHIGYE